MANPGKKRADELLRGEFVQWKNEHDELDLQLSELRQWFETDRRLQTVPFAEAVRRLKLLQSQLENHFSGEQRLGELLARVRGASSPELEASIRQANKDHEILLKRLTALVESANMAEGEFDSWQAFAYEFSLFVDVLEQHEEMEESNVRSLFPTSN